MMLYRDPCIYVVEQEYQIVFNCFEKGIAWVQVGDQYFRDSACGLMQSEELVHRVCVPMEKLDKAREYTVFFRALPERRPYFPELGEITQRTYIFYPVPADCSLRLLVMGDTHSMVTEPTCAAEAARDFDLLVLVGDIPAESKTPEDLRAIFEISSNITHGEKPVLFVQGNHDYRGKLATDLGCYVGRRNGCSWFTFRLGSLWGIVLDCGEDKDDSHEEYGGLVDCHNMRLAETEWLRSVIEHASENYQAPGITTRLAFCHIPFSTALISVPYIEGKPMDPSRGHDCFDIEQDLYREWTKMLNSMKLDAMISAHTHKLALIEPESEYTRYGMNFPLIIGSEPTTPGKGRTAAYICSILTLSSGRIEVETVSDQGIRKVWKTLIVGQ